MDICLINTRQENFKKDLVALGNSYKNQPLDLAYCAAILEKENYSCAIIDANLLRLSHEGTVNQAKKLAPKVIIVNTASLDRWECPLPTIEQPKKLITLIKNDLKVPVIVIGPHGTITPEWLFSNIPQIDILVRGEPEGTISEAVNALINNKELENISGISYLKRKKIVNNPPRALTQNLDSLPLPAYHLLAMEKYGPMDNYLGVGYKGPLQPFSIIVTSRGCPAQCIYCFKKMYQEKIPYRSRSPENVTSEIELLVKKYGIKAIYFHDLNFCVDKKRVQEICKKIIEKKFEFTWGCETRFDNINLETLTLMKKAGCQFINFGFESGSQTMLNRMKKGVKLETVSQVLKDCQKAGILAGCFKLLGLPEETKDTLEETLEFMLKNKVPIPYPFPEIAPLPYPGTELNYEAEKQFGKKITWENAPSVAGKIGTNFFSECGFWETQLLAFKYKQKELGKTLWLTKHYYRLLMFSLLEKFGLLKLFLKEK